eukprot:CAMPEP_0113320892 /NCGR_PEP_ID=MMETSP0010_2-20120614/14560_1 /TAXON_ID=216773 ORGANISM="Corethron hystrix, Strain 308" /NCGR_SAMPLE_ID=MMETSP0010_2 /ASSEMBLY_ACC=CAM_ASM_000155 /LENGTH=521 /DNA_ID=CAMNT_0000178847 /DNA_START=441 /DNA_END=2006 /DNA_ORIENTATION=+ /assembly_acc=CAM_ASM_000155
MQYVRILINPFRTLLKDLRSGVVRVACDGLSSIAEASSFLPEGTGIPLRHLFKDLITDIISLHGQTVKAIQSYAMSAMLCIIQNVKVRSGLQYICSIIAVKDRKQLKDKNVACLRYLREIFLCWSTEYLSKDLRIIENAIQQGLLDPVQKVRIEAKETYAAFYRTFPKEGNKIIDKINDYRMKSALNSICSKVDELKYRETEEKNLHKSKEIEAVSELPDSFSNILVLEQKNVRSSAAPYSNPFLSLQDSLESDLVSVDTDQSTNSKEFPWGRLSSRQSSFTEVQNKVEEDIKANAAVSIQAAVRGLVARKSIGLHMSSSKDLGTRAEQKNKIGKTASEMALRRKSSLCVFSSEIPTGGYVSLVSPTFQIKKSSVRDSSTTLTSELTTCTEWDQNDTCSSLTSPEPKGSNAISDPTPKISNRGISDKQNSSTKDGNRKLVEYVQIGITAINAHKLHIDEIMETLREEMILMEEFENGLLKSSQDGILEYIDTVGVCLDQRNDINQDLRQTLLKMKHNDLKS